MNSQIVVVEDEPDILDLLRDILEASGYSVLAASRAEQAFDAGVANHPDLFLLDLMLPGMSGVELAQRLRAMGCRDVPIIAISASRLMLQIAGDSHLFQETIAKPFEMGALLDTIERYVR